MAPGGQGGCPRGIPGEEGAGARGKTPAGAAGAPQPRSSLEEGGRLLWAPSGSCVAIGEAGSWNSTKRLERNICSPLIRQSSFVCAFMRTEFPGRKQTAKVLACLNKESDQDATYALASFLQKCCKMRGKNCSCSSEGLV